MEVHPSGELRLWDSVVTVGAFDGVHKGHQRLIRSAAVRAARIGVPTVAYTFDPPPKAYFGGARILSPLPEKLERLEAMGLDHVVVASFDEAYASRSAEEFLEELADLNPLEVWTGGDFRFGEGQSGDIATLGGRFTIRMPEPVKCETGEVISSTRVRTLLARGARVEARTLLGLGLKEKGMFTAAAGWLEDPGFMVNADAFRSVDIAHEHSSMW